MSVRGLRRWVYAMSTERPVLFPTLVAYLPRISNGPIDLHDALAAALAFVNHDGPDPTENQLTVLAEHVGGWFGHGYLIRGLIAHIAQVREHAQSCLKALEAKEPA